MPLNGNDRALLDAVAQVIVNKTKQHDLNLYDLNMLFVQPGGADEIVTCLAERVEHYSKGRSTIRPADVNLFADRVMGLNLYLVECPINTPQAEVTELTDSMTLVSLGPYSNCPIIDERRATPKQVKRSRAYTAEADRKRQEKEAAARTSHQLLLRLTEITEYRVQRLRLLKPELHAEFLNRRRGDGTLSMEDIGYFINAMEITIGSFLVLH